MADRIDGRLTAEAAAEISAALGFPGAVRKLGSHQDHNFLISGAGGRRGLLKVYRDATAQSLSLQQAAADRIAAVWPEIRVPRVLAGGPGRVQLLEFVDGVTLSGSRYLAPAVVEAMGALAGKVCLALSGLDPGDLTAGDWDLRQGHPVVARWSAQVPQPLRAQVRRVADEAAAALDGLSDGLAVQVIHGDLTDDNIVRPEPRTFTELPDGIIDFGDTGQSWAVAELAITLSCMLHHAGAAPATLLPAVRAFHRIRPLSAAEAAALWPLVLLRAAVLVCSAHDVLAADPGNDYARGNLAHELAILAAVQSVPLQVGQQLLAAAAGHGRPRLRLPEFRRMTGLSPTPLSLAPDTPDADEGAFLDPRLPVTLTERLLAAGADAVVVPAFAPMSTPGIHRRDAPQTVPLVATLTTAAAAGLDAPWPGALTRVGDEMVLTTGDLSLRIGGLTDTAAPGDLTGGHRIGSTEPGRPVTIGLGPADLRPPAAVTAELAAAWAALCPDPAALLGVSPWRPPPESGPEMVRRRERWLAHAQEHYYAEPPVMVRGWREHMMDRDGRIYLDVLNNVTAIGHAHPRLTRAVNRQWQLLNTNSRFHYESIADFSEELAGLLPAGLDHVFLVNSGTEATDLALRIGRARSGRREVLAVQEAYHGWSDGADAVSTSIADNPQAPSTRPAWVHTVEAPNSYRGRHRGDQAHRYARDAVAEIRRLAAAGTPVGTFIAETFYGNVGGIPLPDGYLTAVYAAVREYGGICVADEVQVGYGRLGTHFWGFEQQDVVPDVVAVAKAMGNGHPLGAVITRPEIAEHYRSEGYFFSSAGGSPVSCVVGSTVLAVMREERLVENARDTGGYLKQRLEQLADRHLLIGAVHGSGLYLGVEFVRDRQTLEPATEETAAICERLLTLGVLMQPTSDRQCVLKIKPPLCFTIQSADFFVDALDTVLSTGW